MKSMQPHSRHGGPIMAGATRHGSPACWPRKPEFGGAKGSGLAA
jgi:hypothetical protein